MKKRIFLLAAIAVLFVICVVSGLFLYQDLYRSIREKNANRQLAEQVRKVQERVAAQKEAQEKPSEEPPSAEDEGPVILAQYEELWNQNNDLAGWMTIEGIGVDNPVMFTPEDPEYYLHRGFDKEEAASGCLFIGEGWFEGAGNTIVYGHHMKDGSMFGNLDKYQSESFARENPLIRFDTLTQEREYRVIAAFFGRTYTLKEEGVFRYYWYGDLSKEERFNEFVEQVKEASLYNIEEVSYGDELLTLSTCSYHTDEGRFVVVAKRIDDEK